MWPRCGPDVVQMWSRCGDVVHNWQHPTEHRQGVFVERSNPAATSEGCRVVGVDAQQSHSLNTTVG
eukprot:8890380-Pyramimonas_sp.AAC.1